MKQVIISAGIALTAAIAPLEARAASFSQVYVFGDSLSDSGNLFQTIEPFTSLLGLPSIPQSPPYARQFSNGPLWVDYLADSLELDPILYSDFFVPSTPPDASEGISFAFGGAGTGFGNVSAPFLPGTGVQGQISAFELWLQSTQTQPAIDALYVYLAGANDIAGSNFFPPATIAPTLNNSLQGLQRLIDIGAQNILVSTLPDVGISPRFKQQSISTQLSQTTEQYNENLFSGIEDLSKQNPEVNFIKFGLNELLAEVVANPGQFGFTNIQDACLTDFEFPFDDAFNTCENPDEFLFWDDFHPTTKAHAWVARAALEEISAAKQVPEPGTAWGLGTLAIIAGIIAYQLKVKQRA